MLDFLLPGIPTFQVIAQLTSRGPWRLIAIAGTWAVLLLSPCWKTMLNSLRSGPHAMLRHNIVIPPN
ncbi:hypothetical protein MLD38_005912 [Melastoma candidum]|uniref:Uncharacterized protein n=1 Tax=Melastoma candidum TaxID=119954 RepID=A0ACB9RPX1_9MYRT|nr:hypothetical protein MLD38_005912 [Melastoma candidum]